MFHDGLFITMTCNPKWEEITNSILPGQVAMNSRRQKVIYKRNVGHEWVNPYNTVLLLCLRSNCDVQFTTLMYDKW